MDEWKQTELGRVPSDWELKKIVELKSDDKNALAMGPFGSNIKAENFVPHGVPVIRGTNLNFDRYVDGDFVFLTEEKADELKNSNCKAGDLVFTHRGTIGQVGLVPRNKFTRYVISQSGMKLTVNESLVNSGFLFYYFKSRYGQHQLLKNEAQVGVPSISNPLTSLKEIEVPLPPLAEQRAITEVLGTLDDKIDLLHRQNKTLEALAESLFRQRFVEEADETWETKTLEDFFPVVTGKRDANYGSEDGEYPFFTCSQKPLKCDNYSYEGHAILLAGNGDFNLKRYKGRFEAYQRTYVLIPREEKYVGFLFYLMKYFLDEMTSGAQGSVISFLTKGMITDFDFKFPRKEPSQEFNSLNAIIEHIDCNSLQIETLTRLRDTLLPQLMSGTVRIYPRNGQTQTNP